MSCYICGQPATSQEHAPARCFFPIGEVKGILTKVDSCAVHNEDTSKDDEYVRNIIAMTIGNNEVALSHFLQSCVKSFIRSPKLLSATTKVRKGVYYREKEGEEIKPTYAFQIDRDRIDLVMRKIAYATYFNKYGTTWNRELAIGTEFLRHAGMDADDFGILIQSAKKVLDTPTFEGTNPEVFKFSFLQTESEDTNDQILVMKFYEGFEVWVFAQADTTGPKL
ncbi:MAG: hypothetical protein A2W94_15675 [Bacteroidetes bacterium GWE2_42_42]|nr:MAG: hypothetical protein A2W94_15675 [Bacteroidetes bacterium GWE2_42_42]HCB61919.1 hypothetical protein [Bacteroidales bacterium]